MLVSAFADIDLIRTAYKEAVRERYRFFSYGDAMLILSRPSASLSDKERDCRPKASRSRIETMGDSIQRGVASVVDSGVVVIILHDISIFARIFVILAAPRWRGSRGLERKAGRRGPIRGREPRPESVDGSTACRRVWRPFGGRRLVAESRYGRRN